MRCMSVSSSVKSVESLRRGLAVFHAIQQSSAVTFTELRHQTGMPKASLLRVLKTLEEAGWISRNDLEKRYVPATVPGEVDDLAAWRSKLSLLASPIRAGLQKKIPWPTDLAVRDRTTMLILDAQRPINALAVNYRVLGFRPSMLISSLGRCYLSFCSNEERQALLAELARSNSEKDTAAKRTHEIQRMLNNSKALGYCQRDSTLLGVDTPERFGAISVPVFSGNQLIACLSCSWLPAVETESSIVQKYLPLLREAAKVIGSRAHESNLSSLPA